MIKGDYCDCEEVNKKSVELTCKILKQSVLNVKIFLQYWENMFSIVTNRNSNKFILEFYLNLGLWVMNFDQKK